MSTLAQTFRDLAPDYRPNNDPWGHLMGVRFDLAAYLLQEHDILVDSYEPGIFGPEIQDDYLAQQFAQFDDVELVRLDRFLDRVGAMLVRAGKDY